MDKKAQIVYFSHGGGPLPLLNDPGHAAMIEFMRLLPDRLTKPDAIIVISAHWEEDIATIQGAEKPGMLYDYYGFPEAAYRINYPAPGSPELASRIAQILKNNKISCRVDAERGFDHGLYIPLKIMYPEADIPAFQLSLLKNLNPRYHIELGKALSELLTENVLIIGSGFSFHNMRAFDFSASSINDSKNDAFQNWLHQVCVNSVSQKEREGMLIEWENAPNSRYCHPREEHLLPLHVCVGAAGTNAELIFDDYIAGKRALAFFWS